MQTKHNMPQAVKLMDRYGMLKPASYLKEQGNQSFGGKKRSQIKLT